MAEKTEGLPPVNGVQAEHIHNPGGHNLEDAPRDGSSDGEGEKSARERLKQTSIAGLAQKAKETTTEASGSLVTQSNIEIPDTADNVSRGRPAKKRSFEDLARDETDAGDHDTTVEPPNAKSGHHKRMRSRDVTAGASVYGKYENEGTSPVHEESDVEAQQTPGGPGVLVDAPHDDTTIPAGQTIAADENSTPPDGTVSKTYIEPSATISDENVSRVGEKTTNESSTTPSLLASSGFANASSTSPFGNVTSPAKAAVPEIADAKVTSPSAFASSGISAFAASENSPFAAASNKPTSGFGGIAAAKSFASPGSGFGSTSGAFGGHSTFSTSKPGTSTFGSSSGFGGGSSTGFGAGRPFGTGMSSFAPVSGTAGSFGSGKPFGSSKDKDEDESNGSDKDDDGEVKSQEDADASDDRFIAQDVETGEEQEETVFTTRAKLYHFEKEWKERGVGTLKINKYAYDGLKSNPSVKSRDDSEVTQSSKRAKHRIIMRTDGVHKLVLNTPIYAGMVAGQSDGTEPTGKTMHLSGFENGQPRAFQIKIGKEEALKDLWWTIQDIRNQADNPSEEYP